MQTHLGGGDWIATGKEGGGVTVRGMFISGYIERTKGRKGGGEGASQAGLGNVGMPLVQTDVHIMHILPQQFGLQNCGHHQGECIGPW